MILVDIVNRNNIPHAWGEGEHLPWDDPSFSEKMLIEHLNPEHDQVSRRLEIIDQQVDWIHRTILNEQQTKILDLGCGPGFYTSRLAQLGHECVGIDISPAAITYAREHSQKDNTSCVYIEHDVYSADYGSGYGLIMMLFGKFNAFNPMDVYEFFGKAWMALEEGGVLLLEPHTFIALEKLGKRESTWYAVNNGLFSEKPHLCLQENCWNEGNSTLTKRCYIVDTQTAQVRYIAQCYQAYTRPRIQTLLKDRGFEDISFFSTLSGEQNTHDDDFMVVSAVKFGTKS